MDDLLRYVYNGQSCIARAVSQSLIPFTRHFLTGSLPTSILDSKETEETKRKSQIRLFYFSRNCFVNLLSKLQISSLHSSNFISSCLLFFLNLFSYSFQTDSILGLKFQNFKIFSNP